MKTLAHSFSSCSASLLARPVPPSPNSHSSVLLTDPPTPPRGRPPPSLLAAAGRVAARRPLAARGRVVGSRRDGAAVVRLDLFLPDEEWTGEGDEDDADTLWPASKDAALLWQWLRPPGEGLPGDPSCAPLDGLPPATPPSLSAAFDALPQRVGGDSGRRVPEPTVLVGGSGALNTTPPPSLHSLPPELLRHIASHLDAPSLASAAATCGALRDAAADAAPGLGLTLFPHQRAAVEWMLARERSGEPGWPSPSCAPGWIQLPGPTGRPPLHADAASGVVRRSPPPPARGARGGLFCDEPGLGKTITMLALMLRTRGATGKPPAGARVVDAGGGRRLYYVREDNSAGPAPSDPAAARRAPGRAPRRAAAAVAEAGRRASAEDGALVRARAAVAAAAARARERKHAVSAAAAAAAPAGEPPRADTTNWAACDTCGAWRRLPPGAAPPPPDAPWVCALAAAGGCRAPAAAADAPTTTTTTTEDVITAAAGWVPAGDPGGRPEHVGLFRSVLARAPAAADAHSVAWWLAALPPSALASPHGVAVPRQHQAPPGWAALLAAAGLEPVVQSRGRSLPPPRDGPPWTHVRSRAAAACLALDAPALRTALAGGAPPASAGAPVYVSAATLLIVPPSIEAHWADQVLCHTAPGALRVAILSDVRVATGSVLPARGKGGPSAADLAWKTDLVVTTFARLSSEWGRRRDPDACPLLRVHWARVVVDEGHLLTGGASSAGLTARLQMACALRADRRWCVSGTPAPGSPSASAAACLHPLLAFLQHAPLAERRAFDSLLGRPLDAGCRVATATLTTLLDSITIRASKAHLASIPRLTRVLTRASFRPSHAAAYNALVEAVERSLLLADWCDPDHRESLLHPRNAKWAREMLANLRAACCVAGATQLAPNEADVGEALQLICERVGAPPPYTSGPPWLPPDHPLARLEAGLRHGGPCDACAEPCVLPLATPCGCLVCVECARPKPHACAACAAPAAMHAVDHPARAETNAQPKWAVPFEVIEWQPAISQAGALGASGGHWAPTWATTRSSKVDALLASLAGAGVAPPPDRPGGPPGPVPLTGWTPRAKAIVFTAFWPHTLLVGRALDAVGVHSVVLQGKMGPAARAAAVDEFRHDDACGVLVMDASGAVGLDLSCASRVYLMEPVPDPALEAQIVARAHRMGAVAPIVVEELVMEGTAEDELRSATANAGGGGVALTSAAATEDGGDGDGAARASAVRGRVLMALRRVRVAAGARDGDGDGEAVRWVAPPPPPPVATPVTGLESSPPPPADASDRASARPDRPAVDDRDARPAKRRVVRFAEG